MDTLRTGMVSLTTLSDPLARRREDKFERPGKVVWFHIRLLVCKSNEVNS
jgi:hypothetical protein